jgi:purine-binding chemotaxis protein CheW
MTSIAKEGAEQQQYLTFLLADEEFAISILKVKEIIEYDTVTKVPRTPKWIRGVINLRGGVVPVVDLAVKFGLDERPVTKTTCIVIVEVQFEAQSTTMGIVADAVSQVMELTSERIQQAPEFGTRVKMDYLLGMAQLGKKFALLLDVDKVLSTDELLSELASATGQTQGTESVGTLPPSAESRASDGLRAHMENDGEPSKNARACVASSEQHG